VSHSAQLCDSLACLLCSVVSCCEQVRDASTNSPLAGLSASEFVQLPPSSANGERIAVGWRGGSKALAAAQGKPVRLAVSFLKADARLYSFWVARDSCGASEGWVAAGGVGFNASRDLVGSCPP
jgi:hypothetical protein